MEQNTFIQGNKNKILGRDTLQISAAAVQRCTVSKVSLKTSQSTYLHIIKRDTNPFLANVPILYPLKTAENIWFSGFFRGYKIGAMPGNGLKVQSCKLKKD